MEGNIFGGRSQCKSLQFPCDYQLAGILPPNCIAARSSRRSPVWAVAFWKCLGVAPAWSCFTFVGCYETHRKVFSPCDIHMWICFIICQLRNSLARLFWLVESSPRYLPHGFNNLNDYAWFTCGNYMDPLPSCKVRASSRRNLCNWEKISTCPSGSHPHLSEAESGGSLV